MVIERYIGKISGPLLDRIDMHIEVPAVPFQELKTAMDELGLSARPPDRILRMARTIADLEGTAHVQAAHLSEAISYRSLERKL